MQEHSTAVTERTRAATLAQTAGFLLRRVIAAVLGAVLLYLLLLTTAVFVLVRIAIVGLLTLMSMIGRAVTSVVRRAVASVVRRRRDPVARPARLGTRISALSDRSLALVTARIFLAMRYASRRERRDTSAFCGLPIREAYQPFDDNGPPSAIKLLRDPATWRDLLYWAATVALAPLTVVAVGISWLATPFVVSAAIVGEPRVLTHLMGLRPLVPSSPAVWWASLTTGDAILVITVVVAVTLLAPTVLRTAAAAHARLGVSLLNPGGQVRLQAELDDQRMRRRLMVEAADNERRRIERDLHDGAQQRLVSLAMNLGMAREKFASDSAAAEQLVAEAHSEAKQALGELRTLARGIHPAVLTDRGLGAALSALAERAGVPVEVDIAVTQRLPVPVESAAYFVVAEALTNVTRHAAATRATVSVTEERGRVVVEIVDDGVGGADPSHGTGLAGLAGRVDGIDGRLEVHSPPGGPTIVRAELPCAS